MPVVLGIGRRCCTCCSSRTSWGRHVYAVGGNTEAARRAGINVVWVKMSCFIMCGVVACLAGMALGSQLNSVSPQTGGNDTLLRAVGAAAIGGVSLFGGRGKLIYPVVGGLVVATIDNGLGLMGTVGPVDFTQSGPKFIVQGLVLLLAASVDAISRQRSAITCERAASGATANCGGGTTRAGRRRSPPSGRACRARTRCRGGRAAARRCSGRRSRSRA